MHPKLLAPFNEITTKDITLRQLKVSDAEQIFEIRSNDHVNRHIDRVPTVSKVEAVKLINDLNDGIEKRYWYYWGICKPGTDRVVGTICLLRFNVEKTCCEIGYELLPEFHHQGLMGKAVREVLKFGFDKIGLPEILAFTHPDNLPSQNLLMKHGFTMTGVHGDLVRFHLSNPALAK